MSLSSSRGGAVLFCAFLIGIALRVHNANGANILGVFTSHSPSHLIVHMSVVKALAESGHNVTVVTSQVPKVTHKAIHTIVIPLSAETESLLKVQMTDMASKKNNLITMARNIFGSLTSLIETQVETLRDARFKALYNMPDTRFDLVILGYFMNDFQLGVAAKFNCPVIVNWMGPPNTIVDRYVGNPTESAYVPNMNVAVKTGQRMTFLQRIQNQFGNGFFLLVMTFLDWRMKDYYVELFPEAHLPSYEQMQKNVSLVFYNNHFSEGPVRPNVPAVVEIGGIQIKDTPNPLPKDVADFLDASNKHGAILFSLGSNLQGSNIKPEIMQTIFKTLSSLKQNVIWKWEELDKTPGTAGNILYKKWVPQDDILAHPNLRLFITHAGKGGLAEAQYHAVPMLALPVFADQNSNAEKMAVSGYGRWLHMLELQQDEFKSSILDVLENPVYKKNIQEFSQLYRDRPMTAKQNVVFWTEYILRHHGAAHMQSPLVHMNILQSLSLDVIAFCCIALYVVWRLLKLLIKLARKLISKLLLGYIKCAKKATKTAPEQKKKAKKQQ